MSAYQCWTNICIFYVVKGDDNNEYCRSKEEDLTEIEKSGCLYQAGVDKQGRPVIVFIGENIHNNSGYSHWYAHHLLVWVGERGGNKVYFIVSKPMKSEPFVGNTVSCSFFCQAQPQLKSISISIKAEVSLISMPTHFLISSYPLPTHRGLPQR